MFQSKLLIAMVGLPARGKSYTCQKLARFLRWRGQSCKVFNVGDFRREQSHHFQDAHFFDPANKDGCVLREQFSTHVLERAIDWLHHFGKIAFFDATNSTIKRRQKVKEIVQSHGDIKLVFLEIICSDPDRIRKNIARYKVNNPDYTGMAPEDAIRDFQHRLHNYESVYQPVGSQEGVAYIKHELGKSMSMEGMDHYLLSRIVLFLLNLHLTPRSVYLVVPGQSIAEAQHCIGGDLSLTPEGQQYCLRLQRQLAAVRAFSPALPPSVPSPAGAATDSLPFSPPPFSFPGENHTDETSLSSHIAAFSLTADRASPPLPTCEQLELSEEENGSVACPTSHPAYVVWNPH